MQVGMKRSDAIGSALFKVRYRSAPGSVAGAIGGEYTAMIEVAIT
jgi:hypothetical protein